MNRKLEAFTTMITPYTESGEVDYATAEKYVDWYFESGIDGIFAICQSSEIFFLTLEEKLELNRRVYSRAKQLERESGRKFTVVSSGHTSDDFDAQVRELNAVWESGCDSLILITNRLDINNEGDDVFIANLEKLISALPSDVKLGLYECPYPYKRLVTPRILNFCLETDKFNYMKDTCCDAAEMKRRCDILRGSEFRLLNANCQTLLESIENGGDGYCGVMCNFHPKLYARLCRDAECGNLERARLIQSYLGTFGFTEGGLPYPLTAKYHMNLCGIPTANVGRSRKAEEMTDYARSCMEQMKRATDHLESITE